MNKKFIALIIAAVVIFGGVLLFKGTSWGAGIVWNISNGGKLLLPLVLIASLIDSINPCAFGILLLTLAFLFSIGKTHSGILKIGGFYILGVFAAYVLIGLGILEALHIFNTPHFMGKVGATLLVLWGILSIVNEIFPSFPIKPRIPHAAHQKMAGLMEKASLPTAFLLGGLVGLCEFPCTGGPYLMVLGLLHDQGTYMSGLGYLILYNLVFVLPLVIILFIAGNETLVQKFQQWKKDETKNMRLWGGIAMVILGMLIFFL